MGPQSTQAAERKMDLVARENCIKACNQCAAECNKCDDTKLAQEMCRGMHEVCGCLQCLGEMK